MNEGILSGVESAVQHREDATAGMGVIHRRAKDKAVGLPGLFNQAVDDVVVEDTTAWQLSAGAAGGAVPDGLVAQEQNFTLNPGGFQRIRDDPQRRVCATLRTGTAIEQKYFHIELLLPEF